jgi:NAD+ diphosphatase
MSDIDAKPHLFRAAVEPGDGAYDPFSDDPMGRCFAFSGSDLIVAADRNDGSQVPTWAELRQWRIASVRHQYLGMLDGEHCWSAEVAPEVAVPPVASLVGLRALYERLPEVHYGVAGRAVQIIAWERDHQFCGRCGAATERISGERARRCPTCGLIAYPRLSPAIIVLIERGDRILLARGHAFAQGRFGIIAGFVEPGETLEDAVRREVREEVNIELGYVEYFGSQPWPFPHGIMIGFRASHLRGEITIDDTELAEAGWYGLDDLPTIPTKLSIARQLIDHWAAGHGAVIDQP